MIAAIRAMTALLTGDARADRVVPPTGFTATLTLLAASAMAFLGVFALALALAAGSLAARWDAALAESATIRIAAPDGQMEAQTEAVLAVLETTPGVAAARALPAEETAALLEPWLGPGLPVDALPLPRLVEVAATPEGFDAEGLRLRLSAEAPGALLDDHTRWRAPMVAAAERLRLLALVSLALIAAAATMMVSLAARASLAANLPVIRVLRQVGARDAYIARAFVRRFTLRALAGALAGAALGAATVALLPRSGAAGELFAGLGFHGAGWLWPLLVPAIAAMTAFWATRAAAFRTLREVK